MPDRPCPYHRTLIFEAGKDKQGALPELSFRGKRRWAMGMATRQNDTT